MQVNGYRGVDFSAPGLTEKQVLSVSRDLLQMGVVAYCPTVITSSFDVYRENLAVLARTLDLCQGAKILGIHLEGPFINPEAKGVHPREYIHAPDIERFEQLRQWALGRIAILSLAPEMPGAMELIAHVVSTSKAAVSLAHHLADRGTIYKAQQAGARACTHVGNGLPELLHRHLNPIWPMLACDGLSAMIVSDGFHLPEDLLKVAIRAKGSHRLMVTSDMVYITGLSPGEYRFAEVPVVLEETGHLHVKDAYRLAGSGCTMPQCMKHLASLGLLNESQLTQVGYGNPLNLIHPDFREPIPESPVIISLSENRLTFSRETSDSPPEKRR